MSPIAYAHNGFTDKFGIPRQPKDGSVIETRIVFEPLYRNDDALRGIEGFSHLWLIWGFSANKKTEWSPTVRPPRLGGNVRVGVFATRSPIRPNPIGLSSVRLLRLEKTAAEGTVLVVTGADVLDGTPIYDIKPYIAYSDSHPEARNGFTDTTDFPTLQVEGLAEHVLKGPQAVSEAEWKEILEPNPRPAYQQDPERVYKLDYKGERVSFRIDGSQLFVLQIERI